MIIRTPLDLGTLIRERRRKLGLDQRSLAEKAGTSRQWIVAIEQGKPRAAIGLILRTLQALGAILDIHEVKPKQTDKTGRRPPVDINQLLSSLRRKKI